MVPVSVTPTTRSMSASVWSANDFTAQVAALFTRCFTGTRLSRTTAMAACTDARSAMSSGTARARPPSASICLATRCADSGDRSATATAAPARASVRAVASPMPLPPPVTTATSPDRSIEMLMMWCSLALEPFEQGRRAPGRRRSTW